MKVFRPGKNAYTLAEKDGEKIRVMKNEVFEQFNPTVLDLGDIKQPSIATDVICAVFDLQGFTNFCKQIDPKLSVPSYLSGFLDWIFGVIRTETIQNRMKEGIELWHNLPFYVKFLGDGLLILWDTSEMDAQDQHNIIVSMDEICTKYINKFLPSMNRKVNAAPSALRCGLTKGTVYSVGDGNDFVGSCINLSARLQRLPGVIFAFAMRGFDPESDCNENYFKGLLEKKVPIRGMENEELIYIRKQDFAKMSEEDKAFYHDP